MFLEILLSSVFTADEKLVRTVPDRRFSCIERRSERTLAVNGAPERSEQPISTTIYCISAG
jgi:hypothetical protein